MKIRISRLNPEMVEAELGYKLMTTYYDDFSIAEIFGAGAVKDTYKQAFENNKDDFKVLTELAMILNWKIWEHYPQGHSDWAELYTQLYEQLDGWILENFSENELSYYYKTMD